MLQAIRFVNCQSFDDVTLDFALDRCNVIVAENNTGKSILFKFLKITANPNSFPPKKRKMLIRLGTDSASMICGFTDGAIGITTVLPNSVIYRYKAADSDDYIVSAEPILEYTQQLGLIIDSKTKFIANIIDTDQDMLLVNSDQKGNNELLRAIAESPTIMDVKDKLSILQKEFTNYNTNLMVKISAMDQILASLNHEDVESLEHICANGDILYEVLINVCDMRDAVANLKNSNQDRFNYTEAIKLIDCITGLNLIRDKISSISFCDEIQADSIGLLQNVCDIKQVINRINITEPIKVSMEAIQNIIDLQDCINDITPISVDIDIEPINCLMTLNNIKTKLNILHYQSGLFSSIETDCNRVIEDLLQEGKGVECPVHGKVIFNGKECIPYNI